MEDRLTLEEAKKELGKLKNSLVSFAGKIGYDCDNVLSEPNASADDRFLRNEIRRITNRAFELNDDIADLEKPISGKGRLWINEGGRYELDGVELTSGRAIEVLMTDSEGNPIWAKTRVEHDGDGYYCKVMGEHVSLDHLEARLR